MTTIDLKNLLIHKNLEFYYKRNGNKIYSQKLNARIRKSIKLIRQFPKLGSKTDEINITDVIEGDYTLFYEYK